MRSLSEVDFAPQSNQIDKQLGFPVASVHLHRHPALRSADRQISLRLAVMAATVPGPVEGKYSEQEKEMIDHSKSEWSVQVKGLSEGGKSVLAVFCAFSCQDRFLEHGTSLYWVDLKSELMQLDQHHQGTEDLKFEFPAADRDVSKLNIKQKDGHIRSFERFIQNLKEETNKTVTSHNDALPRTVLGIGDSFLEPLPRKVAPECDAFSNVISQLQRLEMRMLMASVLCVGAGAEFDVFVDSAASVSVTGHKTMLKGYTALAVPRQIAVADGRLLDILGVGTLQDDRINVPNVVHVKGLKKTLISVSQLDREHGFFTCFHSKRCEIIKHGGELVGGGFLEEGSGLYKLSFLRL